MNLTVPGFAGIYLDHPPGPGEQGAPIAALTDPSQAAAAQETVRPFLEARGLPLEGFSVKRVDYEWHELLGWHQRLSGIIGIDGVRSFGISVSRNRLEVGIASDEVRDQIRGFLAERQVPEEAVRMAFAPVGRVTTAPPVAQGNVPAAAVIPASALVSEPGLQDYVRPVVGGLRITPGCTLGFSLDDLPETHFVMASHCTNTFGDVTGFEPAQPTTFRIGVEVVDPAPFDDGDPEDDEGWCGQAQGGSPPVLKLCRYADAALIEYHDSVSTDLGVIAKAAGTDITGQWFITARANWPLENESLQMTGSESGWLSGTVVDTCHAFLVEYTSDFFWMLCQARFTAQPAGGDSGAPVFRRESFAHNQVTLMGVEFAEWDGDALFTPMWTLDKHFGFPEISSIEHPSPPPPPDPAIQGPDEIEPEAICTWVANVSDGTPPFSYEWRIGFTLVSTDSTYVGGRIGGTPNPFQLSLEVKDDVDQTGWASMWITEDEMAPLCPS